MEKRVIKNKFLSFSAAFTVRTGCVRKVSLSCTKNEWQLVGSYSPELQEEIVSWLSCYCQGEHLSFTTVHINVSSFTEQVLNAIAKIPFAKTVTYTELAHMVGAPEKVRAVAQACGRNPLPLFIPCHRVVAKNSLGGFSQPDGATLKERILLFEQEVVLT